jgi:outer membrane immunogenic protein
LALNSPVNAIFAGLDGTGFQCVAGQPCFLGAAKQGSVGWTVGGGTEWAISTNVTVKAEYLYANLSGATITARAVSGGGGINSLFRTTYDDINLHVARIGINYRFGAPVVAKY